MLINLWWLLVAHFIGDWAFQNRWMAENKNKWNEIMFAHCMIYTGCISIALQYFNAFEWWKIAFIMVSHFITDEVSSHWHNRAAKDHIKQKILWLDHLSHFICLYILTVDMPWV